MKLLFAYDFIDSEGKDKLWLMYVAILKLRRSVGLKKINIWMANSIRALPRTTMTWWLVRILSS